MLQEDAEAAGEGSKSKENRFPWFMMLICMEDVKMLLEFFKNHVINIRGVKVLLERMDDVREL